MNGMVEVGMEAPDFSLLGASGQRFTLSDTRGLKRTLLIFYPQDMTAG
jgi:peroxiredoxin